MCIKSYIIKQALDFAVFVTDTETEKNRKCRLRPADSENKLKIDCAVTFVTVYFPLAK